MVRLSDTRIREIEAQAGGGEKIITVLCGDCDHSDDKVAHLARIFPGIKKHLLMWNGGGLLLDACSPANNLGMDCSGFAQFQVMQSLAVKSDICQVLLETHCACGVATRAGMSVQAQARSLIMIKEHLKERVLREMGRRIYVGLLFHRYRPDVNETEARRMHYMPGGRMRDFLATYSSTQSLTAQVA